MFKKCTWKWFQITAHSRRVWLSTKSHIFTSLAGITLCMGVSANPDKTLYESMLFLVSPINEDPWSYEQTISVCKCALTKAHQSWDKEYFQSFSTELLAYAKNAEITFSSPEILGENGVPRKSKGLIEGLTKLSPYISKCEYEHGVRVEY